MLDLKESLKYFMYSKTQKSKSRQPLYKTNRITRVQLERNMMYKNEALTQTLSSKCDEVYSMNLLACKKTTKHYRSSILQGLIEFQTHH